MNKTGHFLFFIFCFPCVFTVPAPALELSLEENKGESGTVGYVDIDRVFKEYSGTLSAREEFLGEIKKKEELVNQRRREIYTIKADIAKLKQEKEFALTLPSLLAVQEQMNAEKMQAAAASAGTQAQPAAPENPASAAAPPAAQEPALAPVEASTPNAPGSPPPAADSSAAPAFPPVSTSTAMPAPAEATVPAPGAGAAAAPPPAPAAAPAPSKPPIPLSSLPGLAVDKAEKPETAKLPPNYFKFSVSTAIPEIDAAITVKENDLRQKEENLRVYQRQVEKELLEYESHRSEILLGRIYMSLKELAAKEGVSVIVDKRNILFGHSAVDLTGKLLETLESEQ